jgi:hypothetical protein
VAEVNDGSSSTMLGSSRCELSEEGEAVCRHELHEGGAGGQRSDVTSVSGQAAFRKLHEGGVSAVA